MNPIEYINERIDVVATFHRGTIPCLPIKIRWRNQEIIMTDLGLHHPTEVGKRMIHVFDMSDGTNDYRLELDAESLTWTLIAILEGHYVRDQP